MSEQRGGAEETIAPQTAEREEAAAPKTLARREAAIEAEAITYTADSANTRESYYAFWARVAQLPPTNASLSTTKLLRKHTITR